VDRSWGPALNDPHSAFRGANGRCFPGSCTLARLGRNRRGRLTPTAHSCRPQSIIPFVTPSSPSRELARRAMTRLTWRQSLLTPGSATRPPNPLAALSPLVPTQVHRPIEHGRVWHPPCRTPPLNPAKTALRFDPLLDQGKMTSRRQARATRMSRRRCVAAAL